MKTAQEVEVLVAAAVPAVPSALAQSFTTNKLHSRLLLGGQHVFASLQTGLAESSVKTPQHTVTHDGHDVQATVPLAPKGSVCPQLSGSLAVEKSDSLL